MTESAESSGGGERTKESDTPEESGSFSQSPGQLLRQARERMDLTIEEVAVRSRLPKSVLEALEKDDFLHLGEAVYVRGYYRKYAAVLNMSDAVLIDAYQRLAQPQAASTPSKPLLLPDDLGPSLYRRHRRTRRGGWWRWVAFLCLIVLIGWIWHFFSHMQSVPAPFKVGLAEPSVGATHKVPAKSQKGFSPPANSISVMAAPSSVSSPVKSSKARAVGRQPTTSLKASVNSTRSSSDSSKSTIGTNNAETDGKGNVDALTLSFRQTSWVRIEDSTGKILLSGLIKAGKRKTLLGKPPYSVFLGNAPGVSIKYKGHNVDLKSYTKSNSTARFAVPKP